VDDYTRHNYRKFVYLLLLMAMVMISDNIYLLLTIFTSSLVIAYISICRTGLFENAMFLKFILNSLKKGLLMSVMIIAINILVVNSGGVIYSFSVPFLMWHIGIHSGALSFAVSMSLRLIIVIFLFDIYTEWIDEDAIILDMLLKGKKSAFTLSMAIRFYPFIKNTFKRIYEAQVSRGIIEKSGIKKIKNYRFILYPFINGSLERSSGISEVILFKLGSVKKLNTEEKTDIFMAVMLIVSMVFTIFYFVITIYSYVIVFIYILFFIPLNYAEGKLNAEY